MANIGDLVVKLQLENQQFSKGMRDADIQSNHLKLSMQQMVQRTLQARQAFNTTASAAAHFGQQLNISRATADKFNKELAKGQRAQQAFSGSSGRTSAAIQQLIFAVDDATTVYGTSGFSGAVRAAGNNLTMFAALIGGPWALAVAVAVSAITQLYLAFNKTSEKSEDTKKKMDSLTDSIKAQTQAVEEQVKFRRQLGDLVEQGSSKAFESEIAQRQDSLEVLAAEEKATKDKQQQIQGSANVQHELGMSIAHDQTDPHAALAAFDRAKELQKQADQLGTKLFDIAERRMKVEKEIAELQSQQGIAAAGEESERQQREKFEREKKQAEQQRAQEKKTQEAMNKNWQTAGKMAAEDIGMRVDIARQQSPNDAAQFDVGKQLYERMQQINLAPQSEQTSLRYEAYQAALSQIRGLDTKTNQPAQGPSAVEKGSQAELEMRRQEILGVTQKKDKSEEYLRQLVDAMKAAQATAEKQRQLQEHYFKTLPIPGAFDNN